MWKKYVMLDFYAKWCLPCQKMSPIIEEIKDEYKGIEIKKIDIDQEIKLSLDYSIQAVPTLVFLKNNTQLHKHSGFLSKKELTQLIDRVFLESIKQDILADSISYANKHSYSLNKESEELEWVLTALARNELYTGSRYCPCRVKKQENICPCIWHQEELKKDKRCYCGLFFSS